MLGRRLGIQGLTAHWPQARSQYPACSSHDEPGAFTRSELGICELYDCNGRVGKVAIYKGGLGLVLGDTKKAPEIDRDTGFAKAHLVSHLLAGGIKFPTRERKEGLGDRTEGAVCPRTAPQTYL